MRNALTGYLIGNYFNDFQIKQAVDQGNLDLQPVTICLFCIYRFKPIINFFGNLFATI